MLRYVIRRLLAMIPTLFVVVSLTFIVVHATPGGPWDTGDKPLMAAVKANLDKQYHLSDPLLKQYFDYFANALRGDLGPSYANPQRTVSDIIRDTLPVSFQLGLTSLAFALFFGLPLGIVAAIRQNTWIDYVASLITVAGIATPPFVRVSLLIVLLALTVHWLPTGGWQGVFDGRIIIPSIAIGSGPGALLSRYVRSSMIEVLSQDYMRTARAKGLPNLAVITRHALKNALIPVVTVSGVTLTNIITGAFFVERIYQIPGIARQFVDSTSGRDYPLLLGITLVFAALIVLMNLLVDISYGFLDPRIRYQ
jgi:ABC-type dipeptide/oligopeptide/nickel transport system permease component